MIKGDQATIKRAQSAPAGDSSVYINFDAIKELPEEYEVVVTAVKYDPKKLDESFSNVGGKANPSYMPKPELMYKIAEACGISGSAESETSPMIEEIDINPMLMKGADQAPTYRRKTVGRRVAKRSSRMMEDGSLIWSSLSTTEYNVWERCLELWSKEAMYTEGYTKESKFGNKYENTYRRQSHFDGEMKFAHAKAESKAYLKTIRELAGMPTGYLPADLTKGELVFARIRRSNMALKMETAARLQAISQGVGQSTAQAQLFGPPPVEDEEPPIMDIEPPYEDVEPVEDKDPEIIAVFKYYLPSITDEKGKISATKTLAWLEEHKEDMKSNEGFYKKAVKNLAGIEEAIPEAFRIEHSEF